jgi:gliding motility-associated-like protein
MTMKLSKFKWVFLLVAVVCTSAFAQQPACPSIDAQVATGPSTNVCNGQCATLVASLTPINQTNTYVVTSIPYYSYPYAGGTLAVNNVDDGFGPLITLPFNFCYWGNSYNQLVVSSNGYLNFNAANANGFSNWFISSPLPNTIDLPGNSICGPFRDDVTTLTNYVHYYVTGTAPCRAFVAYWDHCPFFSCTNQSETFEIVLYESTNIIDVLIQSSQNCVNWNSGAGIVGIQNAAGNSAVVAPGRNFPGTWIGTNEAWRFTPSGPPTYTVTWMDPNGPVANGLTVTVCPSVTTQYTAVATMGCNGPSSYTSAVQVSVVPGPSITVNQPTVCVGSSGTFTASGFPANSTYTWTPGNQNVPIVTYQPNTTTLYTVVATTSLGCISTATSVINVIATAPVTLSIPFNLCQGATANFSAAATGATGYQWNGPNGFSSTNQLNTITNIPANAGGNYSCMAIFSLGSVSCSTSAWQPLNVIPVPSIAVIPSLTVCERQGATFNASAPGALNYVWTGPNNYSVNAQNPIFSNLTPTWSGIYTVTSAFSNGNITCYNSSQTSLLVKPILLFNLGPDQVLCQNDNLVLNGPAGATSYNWYGSTSYTSNTQNFFVSQMTSANSGVYVLEVDLNGCKTYDSVNVGVLTPIIFTLTPTNRTICKGDFVSFVVGAAQGSENYAYSWNPAIYVTGPTGSIQAGYPLGSTVYNISAYDIACPNYVIQTSFTLTVKQPPQPSIEITKNNVCEPMCAIFNSHLQNSADVTYDFGPNNTVDGDSVNVCLNAGTYFMTITAKGKNGCTGVYTYTNFPITVYPKPGADFTWSPDDPNTTDNQVTFMPTTKTGTAISYEWEFTNSTNVGKIDTSTMKNPTKTYDNNGKFPAMLVARNEYGCVDTVFKVIIIDEDVNIYIPNTFTPNDDGINDTFFMCGVGLKSEGFLMEIYDRWGTLLYSSRDINKGWDGTVKGVKAEQGTYVYKLKVYCDNGKGKKEFKGHVTLLK